MPKQTDLVMLKTEKYVKMGRKWVRDSVTERQVPFMWASMEQHYGAQLVKQTEHMLTFRREAMQSGDYYRYITTYYF